VSLLEKLSDQKVLKGAWLKLHKNPSSYGIDEITIDEFRDNLERELSKLSIQIKSGNYSPKELRGHPLEKGKNKASDADKKQYRLLKIPTVRDRVVQKAIEMLVYEYLDAYYGLTNNGVSYAYVKEGSVESAVKKIQAYHKEGCFWVYSSDIISFFDQVEKKLLLSKISCALPDDSLLEIIELFLNIDVNNKKEIEERTREEYKYNPTVGVAQGSPLSPLFANVYLADLDKSATSSSIRMVRYADDIVIMCKSKSEAESAHVFLESELNKIGLSIHSILVQGDLPVDGHEKHSKVQKYSSLTFLGLSFRGDKVYPSGKSYQNAIFTVRRAAQNRKLTFTQKLISINLRVQGWCSAYSFADMIQDSVKKNDKLLEDILTKMLRQHNLKTTHKITASDALGINGYKSRIDRLKISRAKTD